MSEPQDKPSFWQVILSVLAAFFGVQSNQARQRDFQFGKPWHYIIVGLVMVTLFVLSVIGVVKLVLHFANV